MRFLSDVRRQSDHLKRLTRGCSVLLSVVPPVLGVAGEAPPAADLPADATSAVVLDIRVREEGTGRPLAVVVHIGELTVRTDARGHATANLAPGVYVVVVEAEDGPRDAGVVHVAADRPSRLDLFVPAATFIEVRGARVPQGAEERTTSQETLRLVPGAFGDPVRALEVDPSVGQLRAGDPGLTVRGAEPTQTAVRIDGIDVPWLFHWYVLRSVANPAVVDQIRFRPSGLPASEGGFAQGLVEVDLEDRTEAQGVYGRVTVDALDGSVALKGHVGHWSLSASGRTSWAGELAAIPTLISAAADGEKVPYKAIRWADYHARALADFGHHHIAITMLGAVDVMRTYGASNSDDQRDTPSLPYDTRKPVARNFHRFSFRWRSTTPELDQTTTLTVGYDRDASQFDLWFRPLGVELTHIEGPTLGALESWRMWLRHGQRWAVSPRWTLGFGADLEAQLADAEDWSDLDPVTLAPESDRQYLASAGPWITAEYASDATWVSVGARMTAYWLSQNRRDVAIEPRLLLRQRLSDVVTLTASAVGTSQRPPAWRTSASLGSDLVGVERSWQAATGIEARWDGGVALDVTGYGSWFPSVVLSRVKLLHGRRDTGDPMEHVWSDLVYEQAAGAAAGAEIGLHWTPSTTGLLGVSVSAGRSWRYDGTETWPSDHDRPLAATLWGAWRPGRSWTLSGRFRVTSGAPAAASDTQADLYDDVVVPLGDLRNAPREAWSHQLDLRVEKKFVARRAQYTLYLDVFNATNQQVPIATRYDLYTHKIEPVLYLPMIPSIGLDVEF